MSPFDNRRREKLLLEETAPGAHRGNPQREPSDPPLAVGPWPPTVVEGSGSRSPTIDRVAREAGGGDGFGKRLSSHWAPIAVLVAAVGLGFAIAIAMGKVVTTEQRAQDIAKADERNQQMVNALGTLSERTTRVEEGQKAMTGALERIEGKLDNPAIVVRGKAKP